MEKKQFTYCRLNVKRMEEGEKFFTFEGYASTFGNVDRGGDVIERGAFADSIRELYKNATPIQGTEYRKLMPVLWQHDWHNPIGSFVEMREDDEGLFVKAILPLADSFVKGRVMPQVEAGSVADMSIGFIMVDCSYGKDDVRRIEKAELLETSLVTIPMNPKAKLTGYKAAVPFQDLPMADRAVEWDSNAAVARVREMLDSEAEPSRSYRRAFLYVDEDEWQEFGSYKLPIADVIDGKLMAVPRAIFAAAAALSGARGGVDLPENERAPIVRNVERYYDKMGMESPFKESSAFRVDDVGALNERQLESLLTEGVAFSKKNAKIFISKLVKAERDVQVEAQRDADELLGQMKGLLESFNLN